MCEGQVITKNIQQRLTGALCKLKDYEDTGYSPENVEHLRYILEDAVKELEKCQGQTELTKRNLALFKSVLINKVCRTNRRYR